MTEMVPPSAPEPPKKKDSTGLEFLEGISVRLLILFFFFLLLCLLLLLLLLLFLLLFLLRSFKVVPVDH